MRCFYLSLVGAKGFEPSTSWSQTKHSTRLSYTPKTSVIITRFFSIANIILCLFDFMFFSMINVYEKNVRIFITDYYRVVGGLGNDT